jgi:beta-1,4-N-acetylglucosaminyltransferase
MIFVTVGTTQFDRLIEKIDLIAPNLDEQVIAQIGNSSYKPKNIAYFKFKNNLNREISKADIIIAHGGAGTTFEVLTKGKKLISVDNSDVPGNHQSDLLNKLSSDGYLIWCQNLNNLEKIIHKAKKTKFKKYIMPICKIPIIINNFLN